MGGAGGGAEQRGECKISLQSWEKEDEAAEGRAGLGWSQALIDP